MSSSRNGTLALLLFAAAFFPRLLTTVGAPKILDFGHFAIAGWLVCLVLPRSRSVAAQTVAMGLALLLGVISASALLNGAGLLNVGLSFLLLAEPFLLLLLLADESMSNAERITLERWILGFVALHVALALGQYVALGEFSDDVKGVFLEQGAGHHVAGAVALLGAVCLLVRVETVPRVLRVIAAVLFAFVVVISDSKQVLAAFILSLWALALTKLRDAGRGVIYLVFGVGVVAGLAWAAVSVWPALAVWADATRIETGLGQKLSIFPLLESNYRSGANWVLGLGPGHTVGRLGHMLPAYFDVLEPLGATISPVTEQALIANESHWVSHPVTGSSVWALTFFWAGLWGDLGILGVAAYLLLWAMVWRRFARDDLSRFIILNVLVLGAVFAWPEEPGYMLFAVFVIGLGRSRGTAAGAARRHSVARRVPA